MKTIIKIKQFKCIKCDHQYSVIDKIRPPRNGTNCFGPWDEETPYPRCGKCGNSKGNSEI